MPNEAKSIWFDLDNSPHVPLFAPVIKHYRDLGIEVVVTARDHAQTRQLLDLHGFEGTYEVIGRHFGKGKLAKIAGTLRRARELSGHVKRKQIAVAVSHGSRSMVLAARWLKIPVLTMYDYEFTETFIFNRFSTRVIVPERIPDEVLDSIGLEPSKRVRYPGIKEELYVRSFEQEQDFRKQLFDRYGLTGAENDILVVLRPPATTANYHASASEELFSGLLRFLISAEGVFTVIVPRTSDQANEIETALADLEPPARGYLILRDAVDGLQLAAAADLLISGGGTMNREAALLGVPVYSIFAGRQGALDRQMESEGLITFIRSTKDISKIFLERRSVPDRTGLTDRVQRFVIGQIDEFLNAG